MSAVDPLAPVTMPGRDMVCPHCDSGGNPLFCEWHQPTQGPSQGLLQMVPGTWSSR